MRATDIFRNGIRTDVFALGSLLLLALVVRLPHLFLPYVISKDGILYVWAAQLIAEEAPSKGLELTKLTAFPAWIALVHSFIHDWITAARFLPVVFGILTVIPMYLLGRDLLCRTAGWISSFFYCISPEITSTTLDVIRDPIFYFFVASFLWVFLRTARHEKGILFFIAGILLLLAASIRQNALLLLPVGFMYIFYLGFRRKRPYAGMINATIFTLPCIFIIVTLFIALPKVQRLAVRDWKSYFNQARTAVVGSETLDKSIEQIISKSRPPASRRFIKLAWEKKHAVLIADLLEHLISATHPLLFVLFVFGLFSPRTRRNTQWHFLAFLMVVSIVIYYLRLSGSFALNKRHLIPLVMIAYLYAAVGLFLVRDRISKRLPRISKTTICFVLLFFLFAVTLPQSITANRLKKLPRRRAGEWIRTLGINDTLIITDRLRVGFYADARRVNRKSLRTQKHLAEPAFIIQPLGRKPESTRKRLRRIVKITPSEYVFIVYEKRDLENISQYFNKDKIFKKRWEKMKQRKFSSKGETLLALCFKRK